MESKCKLHLTTIVKCNSFPVAYGQLGEKVEGGETGNPGIKTGFG